MPPEAIVPEVPAPTPAPATATDTPAPATTEPVVPAEPAVPEVPVVPSTPPETPAPKEPSNAPEALYFNGAEIEVDIPEGLGSAIADAGADQNAILSELFGKDSDFTLSAETRAPLDAKFGAVVVDTYLNALKSQSEYALQQAKAQQETLSKAEQEAVQWSNELVGGDAGWDALSSWASESLQDQEIADFNAAMQSGNRYIQKLAISELSKRWKAEAGDVDYSLIKADSTSGDAGEENSPLDKAGYIKAIANLRGLSPTERAAAEARLEVRRRAGIRAGL